MSEEINYSLKYRDNDGNKNEINLKIDFINYWCISEFEKILTISNDVTEKWNKIKNIMVEISALNTEKPKKYEEQIEKKKTDITELSKSILDYNKADVINKRFEIVKEILIKNGIKSEMLLSPEFWDRNVEPADINTFLAICCYKDYDKKKQ
jgi:hypothetical protein